MSKEGKNPNIPYRIRSGRNGQNYRYADLTSVRFGRLIALRIVETDKSRHLKWECVCDCGNIKVTAGTSLLQGQTLSCGCLFKEVVSANKKTHGKSGHKIYKVYRGMLTRCYGSLRKYEKRYKGKIFVCDSWRESFENFYKDMGSSYKEGLQLDRIDNDGDYSPENCRWATPQVQSNNKSNNILYSIDGKLLNLRELESISGTLRPTILSRLKRGWDIKKAVYGEPITDINQISQYLVF
jgi:hypothetical protein